MRKLSKARAKRVLRAGKMLAVLLVMILCGLSFRPALVQAAGLDHSYPRLANYYLKWGLTNSETIELSRWDIVIIDMEAQVFNPENLRLLKKLNPKIKILAYITPQEIRQDALLLENRTLRNQLAGQIPDGWYLKNDQGERVSWWPHTYLLNITELTAANNSQRWNDLLPQFMADSVLSTGLWDGVFYDNAWGGISWLGYQLDLNNDGRAESFRTQDEAWRQGMRQILDRTRQLAGADKLIVTNDGADYYQMINGSLFEQFPSRGWTPSMRNYFLVQDSSLPPSFGIINSGTNNTGAQNFRDVRFGIASALLGDGYFSYDFGDLDHSQLWRYDEYETFLGEPKSLAVNILNTAASSEFHEGIWRRDFEKGVVLLNSTNEAVTVELGGEFEKLHGLQDPAVNDGLITDFVDLPARDGLILLRPLEELRGAVFSNGSFVRVFDRTGSIKRTGFFSYQNEFRGSANIYVNDLDGDGADETLVADQGRIKFYNSLGQFFREIAPYGEGFRKDINLAVGDLDGDGIKEIVTGAGAGGGPHVRIFNRDGVLIDPGFFPYAERLRGGVQVAVGDVNGDGVNEIITAPGLGFPSEVRVFNRRFQPVSRNFLAYPKSFLGGVSLAVGDYNGDGVAEIVTGQLSGGVQIRVFDKNGKVLYTPFDAFTSNKTQGVKVIALDLDGDRATEILATSIKSFTVLGNKF